MSCYEILNVSGIVNRITDGRVPKTKMVIFNGIFHEGGFLLYTYIKIEVTRNVAEYTSSWQSAAGAAKEGQYCNQL